MKGMFYDAKAFNQPINNWNVKGKDIRNMFTKSIVSEENQASLINYEISQTKVFFNEVAPDSGYIKKPGYFIQKDGTRGRNLGWRPSLPVGPAGIIGEYALDIPADKAYALAEKGQQVAADTLIENEAKKAAAKAIEDADVDGMVVDETTGGRKRSTRRRKITKRKTNRRKTNKRKRQYPKNK
jgi:hypothetical protein